MRLKKTIPTFICLILIGFLILGAHCFKDKSFQAQSLEVGVRTNYHMSLTSENSYKFPNLLHIRVTFPEGYDLQKIRKDMECLISSTGVSDSYVKMSDYDCYIRTNLISKPFIKNYRQGLSRDIIINVPSLNSNQPWYFIFKNIENPTIKGDTFIQVSIRSGVQILEEDKQFKKLSYTTAISAQSQGQSISPVQSILIYLTKGQQNQNIQSSHFDEITPKANMLKNKQISERDQSTTGIRESRLLTKTIPKVGASPAEFIIDNPQILNEEVRINYIGRLFIDFTSSTSANIDLKITFPNHRYNSGKWSTANEPAALTNPLLNDPLVCILNNFRLYCTQTYNPLVITIKAAAILSGSNRMELDTEYAAPYNGLYFPTVAGNYEIHFETFDPNTLVWTFQHSSYIYIHPSQLQHMEITSIVKDVDTESIYFIDFTISDKIALPVANHALVTWSRIFIEFPTIVNGMRVFKDNLGALYQGILNERVGCAFLKGPKYIIAESPTVKLECRLIPPEIPGAAVKVEVINLGAFSATADSLGLFIFGVDNPGTDAQAINSFEIKVKINNYLSTGEVQPLFESDFAVFLDPRTKNINPTNFPSSESRLTNFFELGKDVGDTGKIQIKAQSLTPGALLPFFMLVKLPKYLPVPYDDSGMPAFISCPPSNFEYCISAPDVNYVLVKALVDQSFFEIQIKNYPLSISQSDSTFYSMIIQDGRYTGNIEYVIGPEKRWLDIRGSLVFNSIQQVGLIEKSNILKEKFQVAVQFTTSNFIPESGSIAIVFPSSVTNIYPYCRSDVSTGSSFLKTVSGTSGEIGCDVQNSNHWVITGFAQVPPGSTISISGYIDLPSMAGTLGLAEIITYADNHPVDIYTNGSIIDYVRPFFNIIVQNVQAMNPNQEIFLSQRDVARAGDIGDFRVLMKLPVALTTTGTIKLDFAKNDFKGSAGGFQVSPSTIKVCEVIDISNQNRIGCQVLSEQDLTSAGESYIRYTLRVFEDLMTTATYEVRLATNGNTEPTLTKGIRYPTVPSTYKIQVNVQFSSTAPDSTIQHLYIDMYGPEFNSLKVTQHNYIQNQYNVYWFEVQPFTTITINHQLVLEFPTKSNDGVTNLFSNDLGLTGYRNGDEIPMDIFDSTNTMLPTVDNSFMKCHIHHGDRAAGLSVKIVCGNFLSDITIVDWLRFAIGIVNPTITVGQLSIPIMVYSQAPYTFSRTNFNLVNGAGYVYASFNFLSKNGYPTTSSLQMEMPNDDFTIGNANSFMLLPGDAFLVKFNFPIRKNGRVTGGCKDQSKVITYGDVIYHERLRTVVCKISTSSIPPQLTPMMANLLFEGFYTPWYSLAMSEQVLMGIAHSYSTTSSEVVMYTDSFPNLQPRYAFSSSSVLTINPVINHMTQCQRNDYIFSIQLDPSGVSEYSLQYSRLVAITFPLITVSDFSIFGRDCVEHPSSDVEIKLCEINQIARAIYIQLWPNVYSNNQKIVIQTNGLAIGNPCMMTSVDISQWNVNFFSWDNATAVDYRSNTRIFMSMDARNIPLSPIIFLPQDSNTAGAQFKPFDWVEIPQEKYYDEFLQFKDGQYSPFQFDILLTTAIAAQASGSWNTITLYYGDKFDVPSPEDQSINDLRYNVEYCFLHDTRVQKCQNDFSNKKITIFFTFALPVSYPINVYFSIQDPRDREINGFKYIGSDSNLADQVYLELMQFGSANSYVFKVNPFEAKQTNFNPTLTVLPERAILNGVIDYANAMTQRLNVIDITLTINSSINSIKGLKFQIPLIDQFGVVIFDDPLFSFMGLADGQEYPCGNNDPMSAATGKAKCYIFMGSNTNLGQPAKIIMTDFKYTNRIRARFIIKNPSTPGKWVTINVKAYSGETGPQNSLVGHNYLGYWRFANIFQTIPGTFVQSAPTPTTPTYLHPCNPSLAASIPDAAYNTANPLWMDSTTWRITGTSATGIAAAADQYVIFEAFINRYNAGYQEPQFCEATWSTGNTMSDDMFYFKSTSVGDKFEKVFFIKKWTLSNWDLQYFKCKHYLNLFTVYYHGSKVDQSISVYKIPFPSFNYYSYTSSTIKYFAVMNKRIEIEIDLTSSLANSITQRGFNWQDNVNYVMMITVDGAMPLTGMTACYPMGGFQNSKGQTVICLLYGANQFVIGNFNRLIVNYLNQYTIRVDGLTSNLGIFNFAPITVTVKIFAGYQAFNNGHDMYSVVSAPFSRTQKAYIDSGSIFGIECGSSDYLSISQMLPFHNINGDSSMVQFYNNYFNIPTMVVQVQKTLISSVSMTLQVKIQPMANLVVNQGIHSYFSFRFYLEGVNVNCGSSYSVFGNSNIGLSMSMSNIQLTSGFRCIGENQFFYSSFLHTQANSLSVGRSSACHQSFDDSFPMLGSSFDASQFLVFYITVNGISPVVEPSWTRDWVGVKVQMKNSYIQNMGMACCFMDGFGFCQVFGTSMQRIFTSSGYGQGFDIGSQLFDNGVTLKALTTNINQETQLEVVMRGSSVPINFMTTSKILLLQFNSGSTVLFPYINFTSTQFRYPIQCECLVSAQPDFSGPITYTNLDCQMRKPPLGTVYTNTAISVNIIAPSGSYIKCYFPGFKISSPLTLTVTAKIINQGANLPVHPDPLTGFTYGSIYRTTSSPITFTNRPGFNPVNIPTIAQTPDLYDGGSPFTIKTSYSIMGGYSLNFNFNGNALQEPTFYINFNKGGPVPDVSLCAMGAVFSFCRIYSRYRNIMVARYLSNSVSAGSFSSFSANTPQAKQPNINFEYDMIVWVNDISSPSYTYGKVVTRTNPNLLLPSSTIFTAMPQKLTSTNYESYKSNLILSFRLEGNALASFLNTGSKIQIAYDLSAYFILSKGCTVSTHLSTDDQMFHFYCQVDTTMQVIKIQNRQSGSSFSASGLIQVTVGVVNQASSSPITFTLRMYKWWNSATNYGLLIEQSTTYTPFSVGANQILQSRNKIKPYPFYTRLYSDINAPFRMAFKLPPTVSTPLSYMNSLTSFMILDDFNGISEFAFMPFECLIKQYPNPLNNVQLPHPNGYRNYKQNTQYFLLPTQCNYINATALKIEIPRNRDLDNTKYYELVVMPVSTVKTGFTNANDPLVKLNIFPTSTAGHYFDIKVWKKAAFNLNSLWIVTTRPLEPNAIQFTFTTNFALSSTAFPDNYIEVVFNNLALDALPTAFRFMGATIPCSLSNSFAQILLATRLQRPNCVVSYFDKYHEVIKIRVENFQMAGFGTFKLSFDDFVLPDIMNLLEPSNTFTICMRYWSATVQHERCFGQIFMIDRYLNLMPRIDSATDATFQSLSDMRFGAAQSPTIQLPYPFSSTSQNNEKVMIRITGGYSASNPAPLSFTGSTLLWFNAMIGLYVQRLNAVAAGISHQVVLSGVVNPYPYLMEEYMNGCDVQLTYFKGYHPFNKYTVQQPPYSNFVMNMPLVKLSSTFADDIKTSIKSGTQSIIKLSIQVLQSYTNLAIHQNDRLQVEFLASVARVKRCWVLSSTLNVEYSKISICNPKPSEPKKFELFNFWKARTDNDLIIYVVIEATGNPISIKSSLYSRNNQKEYESNSMANIMSVSSTMMSFTELSFTESHYMPGYFEQMITPITHLSSVEVMYLSFFLPQKLFEMNSVFKIILNSSLTIKPANSALNTRLICEWMKVSKYGRQYQTGKFSHCQYNAPNIIISAPTWNLQMNDALGNRIPYLLKIREVSPTGSRFDYPLTSQIQQIILESSTGGIMMRDTLVVHPYRNFIDLTTKHTTLYVDELSTYTISHSGPSTVGAAFEYVLSLEIDSKYLPDTLGIKEIYELYGNNPQNSSIVNNLGHNVAYTSLPNKWTNGIPYSGWTNLNHLDKLNTVQKSDKTVKINLLLQFYTNPSPFVWKIPLLKNPATQKPLRMNLTLWSYPFGNSQGRKELFQEIINEHVIKVPVTTIPTVSYDISATAQSNNKVQSLTGSLNIEFPAFTPAIGDVIEAKLLSKSAAFKQIPSFWTQTFADTSYSFSFFKSINLVIGQKISNNNLNLIDFGAAEITNDYSDEYGFEWLKVFSAANMQTTMIGPQMKRYMPSCQIPTISYVKKSGIDNVKNAKFEAQFTFTTPCFIPVNSTIKLIASTSDLEFLPVNIKSYCETSFRSQSCWLDSAKILNVRIDQPLAVGTSITVTTFAKSKLAATMRSISGEIYAIPTKPQTLVNSLAVSSVMPISTDSTISEGTLFPLVIKPLYERTLDATNPSYYTKIMGRFTSSNLPFSFMTLHSPFIKLTTSNEIFLYQANSTLGSPYAVSEEKLGLGWIRAKSTVTGQDSNELIPPNGINSYAIQQGIQYIFSIRSTHEVTDLNNFLIPPVGSFYQFDYTTDVQTASHQVYPVPIAQPITIESAPIDTNPQATITIGFTSARQEIRPVDKIVIQIDSHNLIEQVIKFQNGTFSCTEVSTQILTDDPNLTCQVFQQPTTTIPMLIHVTPTKLVPIGTNVKINISSIMSPKNDLVAGVTVRVMRDCAGSKLCNIYEGRGWYKTTSNFVEPPINQSVIITPEKIEPEKIEPEMNEPENHMVNYISQSIGYLALFMAFIGFFMPFGKLIIIEALAVIQISFFGILQFKNIPSSYFGLKNLIYSNGYNDQNLIPADLSGQIRKVYALMGLKPSLLSNLNISLAVVVVLPFVVGLIGVLISKLTSKSQSQQNSGSQRQITGKYQPLENPLDQSHISNDLENLNISTASGQYVNNRLQKMIKKLNKQLEKNPAEPKPEIVDQTLQAQNIKPLTQSIQSNSQPQKNPQPKQQTPPLIRVIFERILYEYTFYGICLTSYLAWTSGFYSISNLQIPSLAVMGVFLILMVVMLILMSSDQEIELSRFNQKNPTDELEVHRHENPTILTKFGQFSEVSTKLIPNSASDKLPKIMGKIYAIFMIERLISSCCVVFLASSMPFVSGIIALVEIVILVALIVLNRKFKIPQPSTEKIHQESHVNGDGVPTGNPQTLVESKPVQKQSNKTSILQSLYQSYLFRQGFNLATIIIIQLIYLFVNITTSQDGGNTFDNNSLIVKIVPLAVLGLLVLNMIFNLFLWALEIKFGKILTKSKLVLANLFKKNPNYSQKDKSTNDKDSGFGDKKKTQAQKQEEEVVNIMTKAMQKSILSDFKKKLGSITPKGRKMQPEENFMQNFRENDTQKNLLQEIAAEEQTKTMKEMYDQI